jgi:hypothetical protein
MGNQALIVKVNTEEVPEVAALHRIDAPDNWQEVVNERVTQERVSRSS